MLQNLAAVTTDQEGRLPLQLLFTGDHMAPVSLLYVMLWVFLFFFACCSTSVTVADGSCANVTSQLR